MVRWSACERGWLRLGIGVVQDVDRDKMPIWPAGCASATGPVGWRLTSMTGICNAPPVRDGRPLATNPLAGRRSRPRW